MDGTCGTERGGGGGYRALMGKREIDHFENLSVGGTIILKWISNRWDGFDCIRLSQHSSGFCENGNDF
jgi:hypothetical protein